MEEADVVRIVESSISKKNDSLPASMKSMLESSLTDLKRSHAETGDCHLNEIKKSLTSRIDSRRKETRTNIGSILKLARQLKKPRKPVHPNSSTKFTLPLRKVRCFCQRGKSTFFWPISPTLVGLSYGSSNATISPRILTTRKKLFERKPEHEPMPSKTRLATRQDYPATERSFPFCCQPRPPLSGNFTLIVQDQFQQFSPAHRPNRDPVLLVTSQDIGGHSVLSILPSFSLLYD